MVRNVYCDQELGSGNDDGTSWIHAYRVLATALNGTNVVADDILWVKGDLIDAVGNIALKGVPGFTNDAPQVIACKTATSATPPAQSDLIPGIRTGQTVFAYDDADAPTLTADAAGADISFEGHFSFIYGLVLKAEDNISILSETTLPFEECEVRSGNGSSGDFFFGATNDINAVAVDAKNSKFSAGTSGEFVLIGLSGRLRFEACIIDVPNDPMINAGSINRHRHS